MPGDDRAEGNAFLDVALTTGLGEMRNGLLVRVCDALVCVGGSWGTLSEVALAVRTGVPWCRSTAGRIPQPGFMRSRPRPPRYRKRPASRSAGRVRDVSVFTTAELAYLASQPLMRFATSSLAGKPDVAPVIFEVDGDDILTAGFDITRTVRYRNIQANPAPLSSSTTSRASSPGPRAESKIIGSAAVEQGPSGPRFWIAPEVIISWGSTTHTRRPGHGTTPVADSPSA